MSSYAITSEWRTSPNEKKLRNFGLILSALFFLIFYVLKPMLSGVPASAMWPVVSGTLVCWSLLNPGSLKRLFQFWTILGNVLGAINSRIILGFMFFFVITPIGIFLRLMGKDLIDIKIDKNAKSYRKISTNIRLSNLPY